ncbi:MAG: helix-turn-helix transcriptional regulator [Lachnospiraceae bacterium]
MTNFPHRLKELRKGLGLTQQELADLLNVSQNAIYNWENGKRQPRLEQLRKISEYFNVPLYELISEMVDFWGHVSPEEIVKDLTFDSLMPDDIIPVSDIQEQKIITDFRQLNGCGKMEAIKRIEELTEITRYTNTGE